MISRDICRFVAQIVFYLYTAAGVLHGNNFKKSLYNTDAIFCHYIE